MDEFVIIKTHLTKDEFEEVKKALNRKGIAVASQAVGGGRGQTYSSLLVHQNMYTTALEIANDILQEFRSRPKWKLECCLDCDSENFEQINRGLLREFFAWKRLYRCNACGCKWKS